MQKTILLLVFAIPVVLFSATQTNAYDFKTSFRFRDFSSMRLSVGSFWNSRRSVPIPTPTPTLMPTTTPKPIPINTPNPSPIVTPEPTAAPTTQPSTNARSVQNYIMNQINEYRKSQGLSAVQTDSNTCNFAKTRAQEISSNFNHDGFRDRLENKTLPYPSYSRVTENIAMNSDYKQVVGMWINSSGHAENMRQDTQFVCVEQHGNYFAYEGWKP